MSGFDFSSMGTSMASIDRYGVCLISDVSTNGYTYHTKIGSTSIYKKLSPF